MNLCFKNIRNNKLIFIIVFLLFSLMSISMMPHGSLHTYEQHENPAKIVIDNNKPQAKLKKLLNKLMALLHVLFRLPQRIHVVIIVNARSFLFNMRFFEVSILDLFSFLCFYFHGSKYKHSMNHSDLLPPMAI